MRALTIRQPWASAIVLGLKRVENRSWRTDYRGPLAIHAGREIDPEGAIILARAGVILPQGCQDLARGAILGYVDLVDCVRWDGPGHGLAGQGGFLPGFGQYKLVDDPLASGPWCWILRNPRSVPRPLPCTGQRGLWEIEGQTVDGTEASVGGWIPDHVPWIFTTTAAGQRPLFENSIDASPLVSRRVDQRLEGSGHENYFARRARKIAREEGIDKRPLTQERSTATTNGGHHSNVESVRKPVVEKQAPVAKPKSPRSGQIQGR